MSMFDAEEKVPFQQVLDALLDENKPFPPVHLYRFSDLTPTRLDEVRQVWSRVPASRRRSLLEDLEELVEVDTTLSFEDLARFALKDTDPQVRTLAIRLLWEVEDRKLVPVFIRMMDEDPDYQVRAAAANALGLFVYLGEVEEIPEDTLHQVEDSLLGKTSGEDHPLVRRRALESLGYSSRPEVVPLIQEAVQRGNLEWMASALYAMGRSADTRWKPQVMQMLEHPASTVREEAARAAGQLELSEAREQLIAMIGGEEDENVELAAIWSLSQIGGEDVRSALETLLDQVEDEEEADLIEEALENLTFTEDMAAFDLIDIDFDEDSDLSDESDGSSSEPDSKAKDTRKGKKPKKS